VECKGTHSGERSFSRASKGKDIWDILDVVGKFVIPAAVAFVVYLWNVEATKRNTATQMIGIATTILSQPPESGTPDALRDWAVGVLGSPANPPTLSPEAMEQLKKTGILAWDMAAIESIKRMNDILRSIEDPPSRFPKSPLEPAPLDLP
jgi:hypothetical protein